MWRLAIELLNIIVFVGFLGGSPNRYFGLVQTWQMVVRFSGRFQPKISWGMLQAVTMAAITIAGDMHRSRTRPQLLASQRIKLLIYIFELHLHSYHPKCELVDRLEGL